MQVNRAQTSSLADGTRVYDQKIATPEGARWIAWREVTVRTDSGSEVQSVGRDMTNRVLAGRGARRRARRGGGGKPRQVALPGDGVA